MKAMKIWNNRNGKGRALILVGLAGLVLALLLGLALSLNGGEEVSAKDKPGDKKAGKVLKIVAVDSPTAFQGGNRYRTMAAQGQKLLVVTVDFDRDFKNHLRSSEAGEIFLTEANSQARYYTVDTAIPQAEGPGKKPSREATFVFTIPEAAKVLTFHYGADYAVTLPDKGKQK